jgi:hypothetical protein
MRAISCVTLAVLAAIGPACVLAQTEPSGDPAPHHVAWSYDPVHGTMQAAPQPGVIVPGKLTAAVASPAKTYTGTIDVVFTVKLISTQLAGETVRCSASVSLEYEAIDTVTPSSLLISIGAPNSGQSVDAVVSGGTATCKFSIPYSWTVPASTSTTQVTVQGISGSVGISTGELNTSGVLVRTFRSTTMELPPATAIPPDGTTTILAASTVL